MCAYLYIHTPACMCPGMKNYVYIYSTYVYIYCVLHLFTPFYSHVKIRRSCTSLLARKKVALEWLSCALRACSLSIRQPPKNVEKNNCQERPTAHIRSCKPYTKKSIVVTFFQLLSEENLFISQDNFSQRLKKLRSMYMSLELLSTCFSYCILCIALFPYSVSQTNSFPFLSLLVVGLHAADSFFLLSLHSFHAEKRFFCGFAIVGVAMLYKGLYCIVII